MIPIVVMSGIAIGSTYGSWDLASRVTAVVLPRPPKKQRKYTGLVSHSSSLSVVILVAAMRETMFRPAVLPPPDLPLDGVPLQQRVQNAARVMAHQMIHGLPIVKHRLMTGFLAGTLGGVVYSLSSWMYNRKRVAKESRRTGSYTSGNGSAETVARDSDSAHEEDEHDDDDGEEEHGQGGAQVAASKASSFVGVRGKLDDTQFQDDETAVHTDEDVAGMGYEPGKGKGKQQGGQEAARGSVQAHLQKRYEQQHGHGEDPLAVLGLYGYAPAHAPGGASGHSSGRPDDMFDTLAQAAAASASSSASQQKTGVQNTSSASRQEDEFLESYSDAYSSTGSRDTARPLPGGDTGGEGASGGGAVWDPYDATTSSRQGQARSE